MTTPPTTPPVTDALRTEARANPGSWIYAIDPEFGGADDVPPQGIVGAWRADENGELSEEFTPNPRYVPSPLGRGWAAPTTKLERVLQLVLAGHAPGEQLEREFASTEVVIYSRPGGGILLAPARDGGRLAYVFTDADKATAAGHTEHSLIRGTQLAEALPEGARIALNPWSEVATIIDPADITRA